MGGQLKTWTWNMRHKYLKDLDATGILAFKDHVPTKENIHTSQWNAFIEHEAAAKKLQQRGVLKANRANKNDVHCLGRTSYAEKAMKTFIYVLIWLYFLRVKAMDPDRRLPTRSEVYLESRKHRKIGELHPKVVEACEKVKEFSSSEGSSSQASLEDDALTQVFGKDSRGRNHGVGRVSKGTVKAIQPIKSNIDMVLNSNQHLEKVVYSMQDQLSMFIAAFNHSQKLSSPQTSVPSPRSTFHVPSPTEKECHNLPEFLLKMLFQTGSLPKET